MGKRLVKPSVMIVEDEPEIADTLKYALETEGFLPVWFSNGGEALNYLSQHQIDLTILDVGLPDLNGFEVLKSIRATSNMPVIMLTARGDEVDRIVGLEIGADDYMTKPFSPRELVARVKAVLRRMHPEPIDNENIFSVNADRAEITYKGTLLNLTKAEYLLLTCLLQQPGRIYSRRQLIDFIWSSQHPSDDRVIDTHIKELRAKLRIVSPDDSPLETHRGMGYSIEL